MTTVVVNADPSSPSPTTEPEPVIVGQPEPPVDPASLEATQDLADSAVEIAEIEAAANVEIAQTHAAVEIARIEAQTNRDEEIEYWRSRSTQLEAENTSLREQMEATQLETPSEELISLAPEELAEVAAEAETLTPTETPTTPQSIAEETSSTMTEAIVKSEGDALEVLDLPPALSVPKRGPIIRLV